MTDGDDKYVDEHKLMLETERAAHAKALIEDELLVEMFTLLDKELIDQWRKTTSQDERDRIWGAVQMASKIPEMLLAVVRDGRLAQAHLEVIRAKEERKEKRKAK